MSTQVRLANAGSPAAARRSRSIPSHAELFVNIENVDGSEHLDSHVVAVSSRRDRIRWQFVYECRGVIEDRGIVELPPSA